MCVVGFGASTATGNLAALPGQMLLVWNGERSIHAIE